MSVLARVCLCQQACRAPHCPGYQAGYSGGRVDYHTLHSALDDGAGSGVPPAPDSTDVEAPIARDEEATAERASVDVRDMVKAQLQSHIGIPRKAFLAVDANRDGLLSKWELKKWVDARCAGCGGVARVHTVSVARLWCQGSSQVRH